MSTGKRPAPATSWNHRAPNHNGVSHSQAELARRVQWCSGRPAEPARPPPFLIAPSRSAGCAGQSGRAEWAPSLQRGSGSGKAASVTEPALADDVATVRTFVIKEVIPVASELEHADAYPHDLVEQMKALGLFGCAVPEEFGGLGL